MELRCARPGQHGQAVISIQELDAQRAAGQVACCTRRALAVDLVGRSRTESLVRAALHRRAHLLKRDLIEATGRRLGQAGEGRRRYHRRRELEQKVPKVVAHSPVAKEGTMDCVKCDGTLNKVVVGGVEVDQCGKCSGTWFDFGELDQVLAQEDVDQLKNAVDNNEGDDAERGVCPRCGGEGNMVAVASLKAKDVHIDTCPVCYGQWLDGGELKRLMAKGLFGSVASFFKGLF